MRTGSDQGVLLLSHLQAEILNAGAGPMQGPCPLLPCSTATDTPFAPSVDLAAPAASTAPEGPRLYCCTGVEKDCLVLILTWFDTARGAGNTPSGHSGTVNSSPSHSDFPPCEPRMGGKAAPRFGARRRVGEGARHDPL